MRSATTVQRTWLVNVTLDPNIQSKIDEVVSMHSLSCPVLRSTFGERYHTSNDPRPALVYSSLGRRDPTVVYDIT
jgi:hypothetical protein